MIGIKAIARYVPERTIDNIKQAAKFHESEGFIRQKIGALQLPRIGADEDTSDMAVIALSALVDQSGLDLSAVQALVVVTQNGDGRNLPHTSALVQSKAGLGKNIAAFDISLGCSGYVYGLSVLKGFMESAGLKNGVLITADPYSKVIDPDDRVTALLFGDAATATWLGEEAEWAIGVPRFGTDGGGAQHLEVRDQVLHMNGRQVFNFAATKIPGEIQAYLDGHSLSPDEIDCYCLHQGSAAIVDAISRRFAACQVRFLLDMENTGNTVSSSIPLLLERVLQDRKINRVLISGFGVGLSWATNILTRNIQNG